MAKSTYSAGHAVMLGLLAFSGVVWLLRKQAEAQAVLKPLPGA